MNEMGLKNKLKEDVNEIVENLGYLDKKYGFWLLHRVANQYLKRRKYGMKLRVQIEEAEKGLEKLKKKVG